MSHSCLDNDFESAAKLQIQYMELIDALFLEVNPIPIKAAMNLLGMDAGMLRLPLCDISDKNLETLRQAMQRAGFYKGVRSMQKMILFRLQWTYGRAVADLCSGQPDIEIVAGFDILGQPNDNFPVFPSLCNAACRPML